MSDYEEDYDEDDYEEEEEDCHDEEDYDDCQEEEEPTQEEEEQEAEDWCEDDDECEQEEEGEEEWDDNYYDREEQEEHQEEDGYYYEVDEGECHDGQQEGSESQQEDGSEDDCVSHGSSSSDDQSSSHFEAEISFGINADLEQQGNETHHHHHYSFPGQSVSRPGTLSHSRRGTPRQRRRHSSSGTSRTSHQGRVPRSKTPIVNPSVPSGALSAPGQSVSRPGTMSHTRRGTPRQRRHHSSSGRTSRQGRVPRSKTPIVNPSVPSGAWSAAASMASVGTTFILDDYDHKFMESLVNPKYLQSKGREWCLLFEGDCFTNAGKVGNSRLPRVIVRASDGVIIVPPMYVKDIQGMASAKVAVVEVEGVLPVNVDIAGMTSRKFYTSPLDLSNVFADCKTFRHGTRFYITHHVGVAPASQALAAAVNTENSFELVMPKDLIKDLVKFITIVNRQRGYATAEVSHIGGGWYGAQFIEFLGPESHGGYAASDSKIKMGFMGMGGGNRYIRENKRARSIGTQRTHRMFEEYATSRYKISSDVVVDIVSPEGWPRGSFPSDDTSASYSIPCSITKCKIGRAGSVEFLSSSKETRSIEKPLFGMNFRTNRDRRGIVYLKESRSTRWSGDRVRFVLSDLGTSRIDSASEGKAFLCLNDSRTRQQLAKTLFPRHAPSDSDLVSLDFVATDHEINKMTVYEAIPIVRVGEVWYNLYTLQIHFAQHMPFEESKVKYRQLRVKNQPMKPGRDKSEFPPSVQCLKLLSETSASAIGPPVTVGVPEPKFSPNKTRAAPPQRPTPRDDSSVVSDITQPVVAGGKRPVQTVTRLRSDGYREETVKFDDGSKVTTITKAETTVDKHENPMDQATLPPSVPVRKVSTNQPVPEISDEPVMTENSNVSSQNSPSQKTARPKRPTRGSGAKVDPTNGKDGVTCNITSPKPKKTQPVVAGGKRPVQTVTRLRSDGYHEETVEFDDGSKLTTRTKAETNVEASQDQHENPTDQATMPPPVPLRKVSIPETSNEPVMTENRNLFSMMPKRPTKKGHAEVGPSKREDGVPSNQTSPKQKKGISSRGSSDSVGATTFKKSKVQMRRSSHSRTIFVPKPKNRKPATHDQPVNVEAPPPFGGRMSASQHSPRDDVQRRSNETVTTKLSADGSITVTKEIVQGRVKKVHNKTYPNAQVAAANGVCL